MKELERTGGGIGWRRLRNHTARCRKIQARIICRIPARIKAYISLQRKNLWSAEIHTNQYKKFYWEMQIAENYGVLESASQCNSNDSLISGVSCSTISLAISFGLAIMDKTIAPPRTDPITVLCLEVVDPHLCPRLYHSAKSFPHISRLSDSRYHFSITNASC